MPFVTRVHRSQIQVTSTRISTRKLRKIANEMEREARILASVGQYSTGRLAKSIHARGPITSGWMVTAWVGSRLPYAEAVERGAKRHNIFPMGAPHVYRFYGMPGYKEAPQLKFFWRKAGRTVFTPQVPMAPGTIGVSHPGQKGKFFLIRSAGTMAIKYRMRLIVNPF
jgi:hypothetical protein